MHSKRTTDQKVKVLSAITRVHQEVGAQLELDRVARSVVQVLGEVLPCEACAVLMVEGDRLRVLAEAGFVATLKAREFETATPAIARIISTGRSLRVGGVSSLDIAGCLPPGSGIRSVICTPIKVSGRVQGILHLDAAAPDAFDEDDLVFVEILSQ
jgi:transcriptional regulator with GAF, ATPase, and Fis domain